MIDPGSGDASCRSSNTGRPQLNPSAGGSNKGDNLLTYMLTESYEQKLLNWVLLGDPRKTIQTKMKSASQALKTCQACCTKDRWVLKQK